MQGAAGGIWGVGGMRKKKLAFKGGHPKNKGEWSRGNVLVKL